MHTKKQSKAALTSGESACFVSCCRLSATRYTRAGVGSPHSRSKPAELLVDAQGKDYKKCPGPRNANVTKKALYNAHAPRGSHARQHFGGSNGYGQPQAATNETKRLQGEAKNHATTTDTAISTATITIPIVLRWMVLFGQGIVCAKSRTQQRRQNGQIGSLEYRQGSGGGQQGRLRSQPLAHVAQETRRVSEQSSTR